MCFFLPHSGIGCVVGPLLKGLVHNPLMQFFIFGSSKTEIFKKYFFDTVTAQNDRLRYAKHVQGNIYVFLTLSWYRLRWGAGGGGGGRVSEGIGA